MKLIEAGTPGARVAGLQVGCKLLTIDGRPVEKVTFKQRGCPIAIALAAGFKVSKFEGKKTSEPCSAHKMGKKRAQSEQNRQKMENC